MDSSEHIDPEQSVDCSVAKRPTDRSERPVEGAQRSELRDDGQSEPSSGIHRLPSEIMAYVFEFYVNDIDNYRKEAFPLGTVCQGWRHIAWTTPQFWTTLDFYVRRKTTASQVDLAIEWLNRSGELPLSIVLKIDDGCETDKEPLCLPFIDAIYRALSRCRHLELSNITSLTSSRFSPLKRPSILQSLDVTAASPRETISLLDLGSQVAPTKLLIEGIRLNVIGMNWSNLTDFHAYGLCLDDVLQAFILAPQMKSCKQRDITDGWQPNGYKTVIHSQLEGLLLSIDGSIGLNSWDDDDDEIRRIERIRHFFQQTTFPNLRVLRFGGDIEIPGREFLGFLHRSSAIERLVIWHAHVTDTELIDIAKALPSITHLSLYHSTYSRSAPHFDSFYWALCQDSRFARDRTKFPGDFALLPSLQDLSIETTHLFPWRYLPGICAARHLKRISIERNKFERDKRVVDSDLESRGGKSQFFPKGLIDTWETFSELMELRRSVELDLRIATPSGSWFGTNLFEQSYKKLEAMGKKAPEDIRKSFEHWTATTSQNDT